MQNSKRNLYNKFLIVCSGFLVLLTTATLSNSHDWMAPTESANLENPILKSDQSMTIGKNVYSLNCAYCHGENLEGLDAEKVGLKTSPPNLKKRIKMHSNGDFNWKIRNGRGDMPAFQDELSDDEIWNVINYIRQISD